MFVMLYWIVGGVLSGGWTVGLSVCLPGNKIFSNFYLCTSECLKVFVRQRTRPASSVAVSTM